MNIRTELKRLQAIAAERIASTSGGWWTWIPCPVGSNLGYYERKGKYALEVPAGGRAVKIQYAAIESAEDRAGDYVEAPLTYLTEDNAKHYAQNVPAMILDELGFTRSELEAKLLFEMEVATSTEDSVDLLARMVPKWADLEERQRSELARGMDFNRGIESAPRPPLRPESESVVKDSSTFIERAVPSAVEMVQAVKEKLAKPAIIEEPETYEGIPDYIVQSPGRLKLHLQNKRKAEMRKSRAEELAEQTDIDRAFSSDRGWTGFGG